MRKYTCSLVPYDEKYSFNILQPKHHNMRDTSE